MEVYIVIGIMAFMIIGFILNKWPFGLTTMICCTLLALTGIFKPSKHLQDFPARTSFFLLQCSQ